MTMVKIRNVLGISFAELELTGITLVAGHNAAGKSSICEAVRAALTRQPLIRGITKKNTAGAIVKRDQPKGDVALGDTENWVRITWPKADVEEKGADVPRSSMVAAGAETITGMAPKERQAYLHALLRAEPDEQMFVGHLTENGISAEGAAKAWKLLQEKGWDVFHEARQEAGRKLKASWEEVTVQSWGINKAKAWTPVGYDEARADTGEDEWQRSIATMRAAVEGEVGKAAVSAAEWERKSALAGRASTLRLQLDAATSKREDAQKRLDALTKARGELSPLPGDVAVCPHCSGSIVPSARDPKSGIWIINKGPESRMSPADLRVLRSQHEGLGAEVQQMNAALQAAYVEENGLRRDCQEAGEAEAWLEQNPAPQEDEESDGLRSAREALRLEQIAHGAWKSKARADELVAAIEANEVLIKALAPDGLRRTRAVEVIKTWVKDCVDPICRTWGLAPIVFDENLNVSCGATPYSLLAESEKYRVDVTLQIATAIQDGSFAIVIDRADVLLPSLRQQMFTILAELERPALVAMSARDQAKVPRLQEHGLGTSYWVTSGQAAEIQAAA